MCIIGRYLVVIFTFDRVNYCKRHNIIVVLIVIAGVGHDDDDDNIRCINHRDTGSHLIHNNN